MSPPALGVPSRTAALIVALAATLAADPTRSYDPSYVRPAPPPRYVTTTAYGGFHMPIVQPMTSSGGGFAGSTGAPAGAGGPSAPRGPTDDELCEKALKTRRLLPNSRAGLPTKGEAAACANAGLALWRRGPAGGVRGAHAAHADFVKALSFLEVGCAGENPSACARLGLMYWEGQGTTPDLTRATALLRGACAKGDVWACWAQADIELLETGLTTPVFELLKGTKRACERYPAACWHHAWLREFHAGLAGGTDELITLYGEACKESSRRACTDLGRLLLTRGGDRARPLRLLRDGCEGGDLRACAFYAADIRSQPDATEKALHTAEALAARGCAGGVRASCFQEAMLLLGPWQSDGDTLPRPTLADGERARRARALLTEGCERDHGDACAGLALVVEHGTGGAPRGVGAALETAARGCQLGSAWSCWLQAHYLERPGPWQKAPGTTREAVIARGCELGHDALCVQHAERLLDSKAPDDRRRGFDLAQGRCARGVHDACRIEAWAYWTGRHIEPSVGPHRAKAVEADRKACDGGVASSCANVGWALAFAVGTQAAPSAARSLVTPLCAGPGDARSCLVLAELDLLGRGGERDAARARRGFDRACELGEPLGCARAALVRAHGVGGPADPAEAMKTLNKLCHAPGAPGCIELASLLTAPKPPPGVRSDPKRGAALLTRGCEGGDGVACAHLGVLYAEGRGVKPDRERAHALLQQACHDDIARGCGGLGDLHASRPPGWGGPDRLRAEVYWFGACEAGDAASCDALTGGGP